MGTKDPEYKNQNDYVIAYGHKPLVEINTLLQYLSVNRECITIKPGTLIPMNMINLIIEGEFDIYRQDGIILTTGRAPSVIGLAECLRKNGHHYTVARTGCKIITLPREEGLDILDQQGLWRYVSEFLAWQIILLAVRDEQLSNVDAYSMIRNKILELAMLPGAQTEKINMVTYIEERTSLSRSFIHGILSELRKGNYITTEKGRLLAVTKPIPLKY